MTLPASQDITHGERTSQAAQAYLTFLSDAVREAGALALAHQRRGRPRIWQKPDDTPVTDADLAVDEMLRERLRAAQPGYGWISEESPADQNEQHTRQFIVDPIDGTRAFINGRDSWTVCVALWIC